jgi:dienelactone hydrolase
MPERALDFQFLEYSGAVHAFTNPNADKVGIKGIGYNAEAASRSWSQMQLFFHEIFGS